MHVIIKKDSTLWVPQDKSKQAKKSRCRTYFFRRWELFIRNALSTSEIACIMQPLTYTPWYLKANIAI